jgi:hypothetical protein
MRNKLWFSATAFIASWCGVVAMVSALPPIEIPACSQPPILDGQIDDACWQNAVKVENLHGLGTADGHTSTETVFYFCHDNAWLYIAARCDNREMQHIEQTVFEHDGPVHQDESVEIFIDPGTDGKKVRHFMLSFAGVKSEKTFGLHGGNPQVSWGCPWRSVTQRLPEGWNLEIAIPLYALQGGKLSEARINLLRNRVIPEIDTLGAKQGERKEHYALVAKHSVKDASQYVKLEGVYDNSVETIFAPVIDRVELDVFEQDATGYYYPITLTLSPATSIGGEAEIWVIEIQADKVTEHKCQTIALKQPEKVVVKVPLVNFSERTIVVALRDQTGSLLASADIADSKALSIVRDAFVGRSYYTTEQDAELKVTFGISEQMLEKMTLRVSVAGKTLFEKEKPAAELIAALPLKDLETGHNPVRLSVLESGKEIYGADYDVIKLDPRPGYEVKCDFIRKTLLKDGEPFFPIGINVIRWSVEDRHYKMMSDVGFNMLMPSSFCDFLGAEGMELAQKYNFQIAFEGIRKSDILKKDGQYAPDQSIQSARENYDKALPIFREHVGVLTNHQNLLMYFTGHEPNIEGPEINLKIMEWSWQDLDKMDPYHPKLAVYTKNIPSGDEWTSWVDVLSDDIYIRPWTGAGLLAEPGIGNAYYANKIRLRCEKDHKIMFMVPLAGQHSIGKGPVGNSNPQMLCQNYVSLIYGAKGTIFFCNTTVSSYSSWEGIKTICEQTKALAPALLNYEVEHTVSYPDQDYDPLSAVFPQVVGRVFKYPDGDYLLLAANMREFGADATFSFPGAESAVREFGNQQSLRVENGVFGEKLEPYGVRAYRINGAVKEPFELTISAAADQTIHAPAVDIPGIISNMRRQGKNFCPNPCFERQLIPGTPDFYKPYFNTTSELIYDPGLKGSAWFVDDEVKWNGLPTLCMDRTSGDNTPRGTFAVCYPPISDTPLTMVFSFYAKAGENGTSLIVNLLSLAKERKTFKLTEDWERYSIPITVMPPQNRSGNGFREFILLPGINKKVWVSGLQLEMGDTPTEFKDDSVPQEITVKEDPANLIKNGHAEYGDTRFWKINHVGVFISPDAKSGAFAFRTDIPAIRFESDMVPVDPENTYVLSGQFKAEGGQPRLLLGLTPYDVEKRLIKPCNVYMVKDTETELQAACTSGDKVLLVKDASAWKVGYRVAFEPAKGLPNFNITVWADSIYQTGDAWSIRLRDACGFDYPAGTKIMASRDGNGLFPCFLEAVPDSWTELKGQITPTTFKAWPGIKYAGVTILPRLPNDKSIAIFMDDICFKRELN